MRRTRAGESLADLCEYLCFLLSPTQTDLSPPVLKNKYIWDWKKARPKRGGLSTAGAYRLLFPQGKFLWCFSLFTEATGEWLWTTRCYTKEKEVPSILMLATRNLIHYPPPIHTHTRIISSSLFSEKHTYGWKFFKFKFFNWSVCVAAQSLWHSMT